MIKFDQYFSDGLKPPTREAIYILYLVWYDMNEILV